MKIAMVASESNPLIKSGGLADVVYSLSKELVTMKEEVIIIIPYYHSIKHSSFTHNIEYVCSYDVHMSWRSQKANIFKTVIDGIKFYLVDNDYYFNRTNIYGYQDDGERFAFFTLAVRDLFYSINFKPDIIHSHDWQPGMLAALIKEQNQWDKLFENTKFVFTIHNPAFQGMIGKYFLNNFYNLTDAIYDNGNVRFKDQVSTIKAGIIYADKITTVSPTHRKELLESDFSYGLNDVIKFREWDFVGILNGVDYCEFDPAKDKRIHKNYDVKDGISAICDAKKENRKALMERFGLKDNDNDVPTYGLVSRLTYQKGINLLLDTIEQYLMKGYYFFFLGSGEYELEYRLERLREKYPGNMGIYIGYSNDVAHTIYAGCDFFLMPSLFEPCGIGQMIAERYGTLPIVRRTGGLGDSVSGYNYDNPEKATGIVFNDFNYDGVNYALKVSEELYYNKKNLRKVIKNAMNLDHSWKKSATDYLNIYKDLRK